MTLEENLAELRTRETGVNQKRAVVVSKIHELKNRTAILEAELVEAGVDLSDPEKALEILQQEIDDALNAAADHITSTEGRLGEIEENISLIES